MPDVFSSEIRSRIMSRIRSKNTKPEMTVRKLLWSKGLRYRVHDKGVFGNPDISHRGKKVAVFIDGCFWHGCSKCYVEPTTNTAYWRNKIAMNRKRRSLVRSNLKDEKWKVLEFWQHDIDKNAERVIRIIAETMQHR